MIVAVVVGAEKKSAVFRENWSNPPILPPQSDGSATVERGFSDTSGRQSRDSLLRQFWDRFAAHQEDRRRPISRYQTRL